MFSNEMNKIIEALEGSYCKCQVYSVQCCGSAQAAEIFYSFLEYRAGIIFSSSVLFMKLGEKT